MSFIWRKTTGHWLLYLYRNTPSTRGVPQIEISFEVDTNGLIYISAKDWATERGLTVIQMEQFIEIFSAIASKLNVGDK